MQIKRPRPSASGRHPEDMFIARTYTFFLASLAGMLVCGVVGYYFLPSKWIVPFAVLDCILWILCGWFGWRNPIEIVFPLFTVVTGGVLGLIAARYAEAGAAGTMASAGALSVVMFTSLSIYVLISKRDFSWLLGFLISGFWILLGGFLLLLFADMPLFHVALSTFGAVVFLGWILFDTSRIVDRWDPDLTPAIGAFELFLDLVGLFSYILDLMDILDD